MTDEKPQSEPKKLTPKELADKLDKVVDEVQALAKSEHADDAWAKEAVEKQPLFGGYCYSARSITLSYDKTKELLPEFFTQVVEPAIETANKKGELYKTPIKPKFITLDKDEKNCWYSPNHLVGFGIPLVRIFADIDELTATAAHEVWHGFQNLQRNLANGNNFIADLPNNEQRTFTPCSVVRNETLKQSKISELEADRLTTARAKIASSLSIVISNKWSYDFSDANKTNPNYKKRIKILLEEMIGNKIFGMNGVFQETTNKQSYHFQPVDIENSHQIVQKRVRKNIPDYMRMKPQNGERITIDGRMVKNWGDLEVKIEEKAETLMKELDVLVDAENPNNKFTIDKKDQWLALIDKEVAEFKEQNQPEFVNPKDIPLGGWANGIKFERKMDGGSSPKL